MAKVLHSNTIIFMLQGSY